MAAAFVPRSVRRKKVQVDPCKKPNCTKRINLQSGKLEIRDERGPIFRDLARESRETRETSNASKPPPLPLQPYTEVPSTNTECLEDEEEEIVSYSKNQRWPTPGEPICVMCGRYGAYIVDQTDFDVCSLECKAKHLKEIAKKNEKTTSKVNADDSLRRNESCSSNSIPTSKLNSFQHGLVDDEFRFQYVEHSAIAELSCSKVDHIRINLGIQVKGEKIARPILEFLHCQLHTTLSNNLASCGYATPTPVQMQVIPVGLSMRDVLACAQTGSGKTAAFLIPMIQRIHLEIEWLREDRTSDRLRHPLGIIMAPTRELCIQIERQAKELIQGLPHMKTALLVGGLPLPPQLHRLRSGVQIIVATPGRFLEVLAQSGVELSFVKIFVLDEVDTMLQMGFEQQVREVIEKLPHKRQTLMFSATIPPSIETMATKFLVNPVFVSVGQPSVPNTAVKQIIIWVEDRSKKKRLFSILQDSKHFRPPVVVFVDSKMGADLLAEAIQKMCNITCMSMHGDKSQSERSSILESFLAGECPVIVGTGLLGRGIDLPNVSQVINFDMPPSVEEYVHQVGRAGRLGTSGWALTFINNTNKAVFLNLVETLQPLGVTLPEELVNSPYLHQQIQRGRDSARKRKRRDVIVTQENLMDLLKRSSMRRKK